MIRIRPQSNLITRPADTTTYAAGDLIANSTTTASVTPFTWSTAGLRGGGSGKIIGADMRKSTAGVTAANFILHLFNVQKTLAQANGDNTAFLLAAGDFDGYIGALTWDMTTGNSAFAGTPLWKSCAALANPLIFEAVSGSLFGYLTASAAYVPGNAETFKIGLGIEAA